MTFRVYIEETSVRLFSRTVTAESAAAAIAIAEAAIADESWTEWAESSSDCALEVREELTEQELPR
jgi:hypothetical protein